jgi:hypothetical protein
MKTKTFFAPGLLSIAAALFFAGCSASVSSDQESLSYDLTSDCPTGRQSFNSKTAYCAGLTDRKLNNGCALDLRKDTYASDCGSGFQETNIPATQTSGFDNRLKTQCSTAEAPNPLFATQSDYCNFLKDESIQQGCHWDDRKSEFEKAGCTGDFSPAPAVTNPPTPAPQPNPQQPPTPAPKPQNPAVVDELAAAGITVKVEYPIDEFPMPGEKSFREKLPLFWPVLEQVKDELIANKEEFLSISVTDYAAYDSDKTPASRLATFDVDFSAEDIHGFIGLTHRYLEWQRKTSIQVQLSIVYFTGTPGDKLDDYRKKVEFFEANTDQLAALKGEVLNIEFSTYADYDVNDRKMQVSSDKYADEILHFASLLTPIAPFFTWADGLTIPLSSSGASSDPTQIIGALKQAMGFEDVFADLKKFGKLDKIEFANSSEVYFSKYGGTLTFPTSAFNSDQTTAVLHALQTQYQCAAILGITVEQSETLDSNYVKAVTRLKANLGLIQGKRSGIHSISFSTTTSFSSGVLYIGYSDSDQDLAKILNQIPG